MRTRRSLIHALSLGLVLAVVTGCGQPAAQAPTAAPKTESKPAESKPAETKPAAPAAPAQATAAKPAESKPAEAAKPADAAKPAAAGTVSCADAATKGGGGAPIKIGSSISLTGATANFGVNMRRGVEICLKEFNEAGGYQGRQVEVIFLDDQVKPEIAVNNVTRFITQDKVIGVLGPVNSGNALAFRPKVEEAEIPTIVPISTSVSVVYDTGVYEEGKSKPSPWMFRTSMQDNYQVETILAYAKKKGWDAIGLMHDTSGYGTASKDTAEKLIPASGFKILATETYNIGDTDMTSQLQKLQAAGVKQIINFGLGPEDANLLRSAQKINYKVQWSGAWGWTDPVVLDLAGKDLAEGVISVASFTIDASPAAADFHQKMLSAYKEDPFPITSAQGYDAAHIMFLALAKSGPDPKKLRDAIEQVDGFKAVTSAPEKPFGPARHHSLEGKDMFAATFKNGQLVKAD
jgi:branched-chain amino acid transport system substrate-binding protein